MTKRIVCPLCSGAGMVLIEKTFPSSLESNFFKTAYYTTKHQEPCKACVDGVKTLTIDEA